jgi:hypothetical protein
MIRYLVRKASSDTYFSIKTFHSLDELMTFQKKSKHSVILKNNFWYNEDLSGIREAFHVNNKVAKRIRAIHTCLVIYDSFIE